jgi:ribosomal RNA assembly protein
MRKLVLDKPIRVIKAKGLLEKKLNIKLSFSGREVSFEGNPETEYISEKVLEAIDFGFPIGAALMIEEEDFVLEIFSIKDYTKKKSYERIRGRIIGKNGRTKKTIMALTDCFIELKDNRVGILGYSENVSNARQAIISIIQGAKQSNVYAYLEHHKPIQESF